MSSNGLCVNRRPLKLKLWDDFFLVSFQTTNLGQSWLGTLLYIWFLPGQGLRTLKEFLQAKMERQHIPRGIFWGEIFHVLLAGFVTGASLKLANISTLKESLISTSLISLSLKTNPTSQKRGLLILCTTQWCLDALDFESSDIVHLCLRGMTHDFHQWVIVMKPIDSLILCRIQLDYFLLSLFLFYWYFHDKFLK